MLNIYKIWPVPVGAFALRAIILSVICIKAPSDLLGLRVILKLFFKSIIVNWPSSFCPVSLMQTYLSDSKLQTPNLKNF